MRVTVDKFGRIVIPKGLRARLGLRAGAELEVEERASEILLRPIVEDAQVVREGRLLVFVGRPTGDLDGALGRLRNERDAKLAGSDLPP